MDRACLVFVGNYGAFDYVSAFYFVVPVARLAMRYVCLCVSPGCRKRFLCVQVLVVFFVHVCIVACTCVIPCVNFCVREEGEVSAFVCGCGVGGCVGVDVGVDVGVGVSVVLLRRGLSNLLM